MHRNTKMATCCYCGARAALVLGQDRHELVCASCGAPLHTLKAIPRRDEAPRPHKRGPERKPDKPEKRRKSRGHWFLKEAIDLLDDIFD